MAKETPEYQRNTPIKPAAGPVGFDTAAAGVGSSLEALGAMSAGFASNASDLRSKIAGQEAGRSPRKGTASIPITRADYNYKQAYVDESTKVLAINADRIIANVTDTFNKNPRPDGEFLRQVHEETLASFTDLLDMADPSVKNDLSRAFYQQYDATFTKFGNRVEESDNQVLLDNFKNYTEGNLVKIFDLSQVGDFQGVADAEQEQYKNLQSARYRIGEKAYVEGLMQVRMAVMAAKNELEMMAHYRDGGDLAAAKYIQDYAKKEHPGVTQSERDALVPMLLQKFNNVTRIDSLSDNLLLGKAAIEMEQNTFGMLPPRRFEYYRENLSEEAFGKVELAQVKAQNVLIETSALANFMNANQGSSIGLSNLTTEQLEKGYALNKKTHEQNNNDGQPLDLQQEAEFARTYDTTIPSFNKKLAAGINSQNAETAVAAAQVYDTLSRDNLSHVKGIDAGTALKADKMNSLVGANVPDFEAWKYASEKIDNLTPAQITEQKELFKEKLKSDSSLRGPTKQDVFVAEQMGFKAASPGLRTEYMAGLENNFIRSRGDWDAANDLTKKQMAELWSETVVNGALQTMRLAPDRKVPVTEVRNQLVDKMAASFENQRKIFNYEDMDGVDFYFEFPEGEIDRVKKEFNVGSPWLGLSGEDIIAGGVAGSAGGPWGALAGGVAGGIVGSYFNRRNQVGNTGYINLDRVGIGADGQLTREKGVMTINSDKYTELPPAGQPESYGVLWHKDGDLMPTEIYSATDNQGRRNFQLQRFSVTPPKNSINKEKQQIAFEEFKALEESKATLRLYVGNEEEARDEI